MNNETEQMAQRQPWRTGQGASKTALDPSWKPERVACKGDIAMEEGNKWWWCKRCGYCGWGLYTRHAAPKHPADLFRRSREYFFERRKAQGLNTEEAQEQALHLQAIVLRVAATLKPEDLKRYIDEHVIPLGF